MKKLFAIGSMMFVLSLGIACAQGGPPGGGMRGGGRNMSPAQMQQRMAQRRKEQRDEAIKRLKLTPAQIKKYDEIDAHSTARMEKLRAQAKGGRPDFSQFKPIMDERNSMMTKMLSPGQQAEFKKMQAERRSRGRGGPGGGMRPGGRPGGA